MCFGVKLSVAGSGVFQKDVGFGAEYSADKFMRVGVI